MVSWLNLRTVRSEPGFDTELRRLFPDPAVRDDRVLLPVEWALARNPEAFPIAGPGDIRIAYLDPVEPGVDLVEVAFRILDDNMVSLLDIRVLVWDGDDGETDEGS